MRIVSIITAVVVIFVLYILVFEREAFNKVANGNSIKSVVYERLAAENIETQAKVVNEDASKQSEEISELVSDVVYTSNSQTLGSTVILRGETEAARFVEVRAETFGQVITEPVSYTHLTLPTKA